MIRFPDYIKPIYIDKPICVVAQKLDDVDISYLMHTVNFYGGNSFLYDPYLSFSKFSSNQVIFLDKYDEFLIQDFLEWSIDIICVGDFDEITQRDMYNKGITSYWDTNSITFNQIVSCFGLQYKIQPMIHCLIWTNETVSLRILQSILEKFGVNVFPASQAELSLFKLSETDFDLVIVDWDHAGLDILLIMEEFKTIKQKKKFFPTVLGIKDFQNLNLYRDLSAGIKEFSPALFSVQEMIHLLIQSVPFQFSVLDNRNIYHKDDPILFRKSTDRYSKQFNLQFDYPQNLFPEINTIEKNFYLNQIKRQFEWLTKL